MEFMDKQLKIIESYRNYLDSILFKGYNNNITIINTLVSHIKKIPNLSLATNSESEQESEESDDEIINYKSNFIDIESEELSSHENKESDTENKESETEDTDSDSDEFSLNHLISKNIPINGLNDKALIFINQPIDTSNILLYKKHKSKQLMNYIELIKSY
jgi:hypothetical protein